MLWRCSRMWKTIVLCASLFGSAALGLVTAARWVEPAALPMAAAIGLCLVGIVLILAAPGRSSEPLQTLLRPAFSNTSPRLEAIDAAPKTVPLAAATGPQPSLH